MKRVLVALVFGFCWHLPADGEDVAGDLRRLGRFDSSGVSTLGNSGPSTDEVGRLPSVRNREASPIGGWNQLTREIDFSDDHAVALSLIVEVMVDWEGRPKAVWIRTQGVGEQDRFKEAVLNARFYPALRDFEPADSLLYQPLVVRRDKPPEAQPSATDNPDDAQRLREDY